MKQKHIIFTITGSLLISGALITGLSNATIKSEQRTKSMLKAQNLDLDNDGLISLAELTARHNQRFNKLDHDDNGLVDQAEYNASLISMFNRLDTNNDGFLKNDELLGDYFRYKKSNI